MPKSNRWSCETRTFCFTTASSSTLLLHYFNKASIQLLHKLYTALYSNKHHHQTLQHHIQQEETSKLSYSFNKLQPSLIQHQHQLQHTACKRIHWISWFYIKLQHSFNTTSFNTRFYKLLITSPGLSKILPTSPRFTRILQDSADFAKIRQDSPCADFAKIRQDSPWVYIKLASSAHNFKTKFPEFRRISPNFAKIRRTSPTSTAYCSINKLYKAYSNKISASTSKASYSFNNIQLILQHQGYFNTTVSSTNKTMADPSPIYTSSTSVRFNHQQQPQDRPQPNLRPQLARPQPNLRPQQAHNQYRPQQGPVAQSHHLEQQGKSQIRCAYCKKFAHNAEECRKRISDKAPCISNRGIAYYPERRNYRQRMQQNQHCNARQQSNYHTEDFQSWV